MESGFQIGKKGEEKSKFEDAHGLKDNRLENTAKLLCFHDDYYSFGRKLKIVSREHICYFQC